MSASAGFECPVHGFEPFEGEPGEVEELAHSHALDVGERVALVHQEVD